MVQSNVSIQELLKRKDYKGILLYLYADQNNLAIHFDIEADSKQEGNYC